MEHGDRPVLVFKDGEHSGKRVTMQNETLIVGRDQDCDLVLDERQVSRQHIKIKHIENLYYVEDLNSKNGTWVNGVPLKGERTLTDGDMIEIALVVKLIFAESEATAPMSLSRLTAASESRLRLDPDSRRVYVNNTEIDPPLSLPQYRLLELLLKSEGAVCTRNEVIEAVWPDAVSEGVSEQAIDALVRRLRDRITEIDPEHQYIITVRGHGFRLGNT